jgi:UDP-N-acetylglucosamine:LPS N-acetylglucosamine transferase
MNTKHHDISELAGQFKPPVLVLSTNVGRGVVSIGEAVAEKLGECYRVYHEPIEDFLPAAALAEDVKRYRFISTKLPFLLNIPYRFPPVYYRKYFREKYIAKTRLDSLKARIDELGIKTLICCSHRPAFWAGCLKMKTGVPVEIWGLLSEFGRSLGWKYIFWNQMKGYLSPVPKSTFDYRFPYDFRFFDINLPVRKEFSPVDKLSVNRQKVLLVCGYWGQGPIFRIIKSLRRIIPELEIFAVCGQNSDLLTRLSSFFNNDRNIHLYGALPSLASLLSECATIITKPGISSIIEAHAMQRKIFLVKGMPVAEDNNARYAIKNFGAEWFSVKTFTEHYLKK